LEARGRGINGMSGREIKHTRLDPRLLTLIDDELLQLLLVAVAQLAEVCVAEVGSAEIHVGDCVVRGRVFF
jgi:hypothetical protein